MVLLYVLISAVLFLMILLFTVKSEVDLVFDSTDSDIHVTLLWLYPFFKSVVAREKSGFVMTVYLFNRKVLTKLLNPKQDISKKENVQRVFNPTDIHVDTSYGFRDPFVTGLASSAITMASGYFNVESLNQKPDFLATNDYISLDATAKLNLGRSLLKLI